MKLILKPEPRVTNSYHGRITILEGGELHALSKEFHRQMKLLKKKKPDLEERIAGPEAGLDALEFLRALR